MAYLHLKSVRTFQINLIKSLFTTKTYFFDITPSGAIINKFSNDTGLTDVPLFQYIIDLYEIGFLGLSLMGYIVYINQWLLICMILEVISVFLFYKLCN